MQEEMGKEVGGETGQLAGKAGEEESRVEFSSISPSPVVYSDKHVAKKSAFLKEFFGSIRPAACRNCGLAVTSRNC